MSELPNIILGIEDFLASLAMLWAAQKITTHAGIRNKVEIWALIRRVVYWLLISAFAYMGLSRLAGWYETNEKAEVICQSIVAWGIIFFPLMRALGFVTQDMLIGHNRQRIISDDYNGH